MPGRRIREDYSEYRDLVKDKVKSRLKEHIRTGKKVKRHGKDMIVVDIPVVDLPSFRHGRNKGGGIGNGPGKPGDEVGDGPAEHGEPGKPGDQPGEHTMGVGVDVESFIDLLGEELNLPLLKPKQDGNIKLEKVKYNRLSRVGTPCLLHKKKTLKNAIKRSISAGEFDPDDITNIYPIQQDKVYKSWNIVENPDSNAVIFFLQDISYSMGAEKRDLVRELCWYLEQWIRKCYDEVDMKHIVHDVNAQEVDQEKFYRLEAGGGTKISSAFQLCKEIIEAAYPPNEWNVYIFYFSDGENWTDDNKRCVDILSTLQQYCNLIGIGEVKGENDWADFMSYIDNQVDKGHLSDDVIVTSAIDNHQDVLATIEEFLTHGTTV